NRRPRRRDRLRRAARLRRDRRARARPARLRRGPHTSGAGPAHPWYPAPHKAAVISMVMDDVHPHDLGTILDREGVAVRTGHHCAQPLMERFDVPATARASLALYNEKNAVDALVRAR